MTYIEFFDENVIENICSCLVSIPDRVIMLGDNERQLASHAARYTAFFNERGKSPEFLYRALDCTNLSDIVEKLSELVEEYEDCVFDLTGGSDLLLVAIGIVYYRYRDMDIQLHRFNLRDNKLYDCDCDGRIISIDDLPQLSVRELIKLYGGRVVYDHERRGTTFNWDWNAGFISDVEEMWGICRKDVFAWNILTGTLSYVEKYRYGGGPLTVIVDKAVIRRFINGQNYDYHRIRNLFYDLADSRLIIKVSEYADELRFTYKNQQVKSCLMKSGQALELKITLSAMLAKDRDGEYVYTDARNGVFIDWDAGDLHQAGKSTENEIDVIMMHGMVPVFVSCKNGTFNKDELYKLNTVATQFGGRYAKKVLVVTSVFEKSAFTESLRMRADDMGIQLVINPQKRTQEELNDIIGSLWRDDTTVRPNESDTNDDTEKAEADALNE